MASLTASVRSSAETHQVDVAVESSVVISDPVAYVQQDSVSADILATAGLSAQLEQIAAVLQSSTSVAGIYTYNLLVTYGDAPAGTTSHTHDSTTVTVSLDDAYEAGTTIVLDSTLGAVTFTAADDTSVDYLRIKTDLDTTPRDLLWLRQGSILRVGAHTEYYADATYDIGTPDGGTTLRRPRDVRLGRDLYAAGNAIITGYGDFSSYVLSAYNRFTAQASNPDNTSSVRHVYVNSTDNSLRYWDGSTDNIISGGAGTSGDTVGLYNCAAGIAVGDVVKCTSIDTVVAANATTLAGTTIAGIVVSKPTSTTCNVKYIGETGNIFAGGLTPGNEYRVARTDGGITDSTTGFTTGDTDLMVGFAKDTNTLVVRIGEPSVR